MKKKSFHVSLVIVPDATLGTVTGLFEALSMFESLVPDSHRFVPEVVSAGHPFLSTACGLPFNAHHTVADVEATDIVILPSLLLEGGRWQTGRYPRLVEWLERQHAHGAMLCSACSGVLILAETGLLDGCDATLHWAYERAFVENFPAVRVRLQDVLVVSGPEERFVMSGASASWHDLLLYLIGRLCGADAARTVAKFFLLQRHADGQAPFIIFQERLDHGDAAILAAQGWMRDNMASDHPVEQVVAASGLPERSFKRRFRKATGLTPIAYVQHLRIEAAKRELEIGSTPIDEVSYGVGYEEPAFFRRLFKRITGMTPSAYRRKFRVPLVEAANRSGTDDGSLTAR